MNKAVVKYHNDYLQLFTSSGELIPYQSNLILENETGSRKTAAVTITLIADISQIGETVNNDFDLKEAIKDLHEKLDLAHRSAIFWEKLYEAENSKKWYQKLFNL